MEEHQDVCVVVPMYNEGEAIAAVVTDLLQTFPHVVCVDDGSRDDSAQQAAWSGARVVRHAQNLGQGAALQTGIEFATRQPGIRWVVTFDADGQHRVSDAIEMVALARRQELDVVLGSRFLGSSSTVPAARRALLKAAVLFTRVTSRLSVTDAHNGLRVLSRSAAQQIRITLDGMAHASEIVEQVASRGLRWSEHPVTIVYTDYSRAKGQSGLNAVNISFDLLGKRLRSTA